MLLLTATRYEKELQIVITDIPFHCANMNPYQLSNSEGCDHINGLLAFLFISVFVRL